jgi:dolichyl-phosphate-mannose--protein O-mannosyl transferase
VLVLILTAVGSDSNSFSVVNYCNIYENAYLATSCNVCYIFHYYWPLNRRIKAASVCVYVCVCVCVYEMFRKSEMNTIFKISVRNPPKLWDKLIQVYW